MNQKNYDYLAKQVKLMGFGESLEKELKTQIAKEETKFRLEYETEFNGNKVLSTLMFNKSSQSDMYFFNNYRVATIPENAKESLQQNFYINNEGQSITLKEAYNLMNGRAVFKDKLANKDKEIYAAWVKLDFKDVDFAGQFKQKKYNENYGFNLEEAIGKHPIMEVIDGAEKEKLIQSLQKGNRPEVTFNLDGQMEKRYIEANPLSHGLNVYDSEQRIILQKQTNGQKQGENLKNSQSQANDQQVKNEQKKQYRQRPK